jgi:hypothetical protein
VLFLLLLILVVIGIWKNLDRSMADSGSAATNGSGSQAADSKQGDGPKDAPSEAQSSGSHAPSQQVTPTQTAPPSSGKSSPPPQSSGDTAPSTGPPGPIATRKDDEDGSSVLGGSFFGIRADGRRFVYVVDCSGSMIGAPYQRAQQELIRSLAALTKAQEFFVILFSDDSYPMFFPNTTREFVKASDEAIEQVQAWVISLSHHGGTNPEPALALALKMKPDAVFFLTDGAIPDSTPDSVRQANKSKVSVHTIGFMNRAGETALQRIAEENNGRYLFVR